MRMNGHTQTGVTLVELAIVLVIIGLISVAILKGQELIINSQISSTISEMESYNSSIETFRFNYGIYPGNMANARFRLENCDADPCGNGDGDFELDINVGAANTISDEGAYFFNQLRAAEIISGFSGANILDFGEAFPSAVIGGGYMVGDVNNGVTAEFTASEMRPVPHLVLIDRLVDVGADTGILTPLQAARIDRTIDDGNPDSGAIVAQNTADTCRDGVGTYDEISLDQLCVIAYALPPL